MSALSPRQVRVLRLLATADEPVHTYAIARELHESYARCASTIWALARRGLAEPIDVAPADYCPPQWCWRLTSRAAAVWR